MRNQRNQKNQRNKQSLKSLKKPLPMLMAAALALALLAGCGSTASPPATSTAASVTTASEAPDSGAQDSDSPDSDSPDSASPDSGAQGSAAESAAPAADTAPAPALDEATIKIYLTGDAPKYLDEVWNNVADKSKGVLNAKFAVNYIPWSDYADKMTMLAASGDDFDLYFDANWLIWPTMVKNGALLGLNDLFDQYAPNLKAYLEAPGLLEWAKVNGEFMGVPIDDAGTQRPIVAIREDLRVKYDLPDSMATMEELEAYLDVVTANEDIRAINNIIQANMWDNALFAIACKYSLEREFGQGNFDLTYYLTDEKVTIVPMERTEAFREASVIRERWYQKGWIPQNAMNDTETVALLNDGKYAASIRGVQDAAGGITSGPGEAKTYVMYPDSLASIGGTLGNMVCFNRNAKNPERTMMFLEWMNASQENYSAVMYGIEGVTYVIEDGVLNYPAGQDAGTSYLNWGGAWGFVRNQWRLPAFDYTPELKAAKAADLAMPTNVRSTLAGFTFDTEPVSTEIANRQAVTDQYGKMLQYGLRSDVDAAIQEYIAKADEAGTDKIVAELQRQIDEFIANK